MKGSSQFITNKVEKIKIKNNILKSKPKVLTFSHQKKGHGTLPRHERMAIALKKKVLMLFGYLQKDMRIKFQKY